MSVHRFGYVHAFWVCIINLYINILVHTSDVVTLNEAEPNPMNLLNRCQASSVNLLSVCKEIFNLCFHLPLVNVFLVMLIPPKPFYNQLVLWGKSIEIISFRLEFISCKEHNICPFNCHIFIAHIALRRIVSPSAHSGGKSWQKVGTGNF